MPYKVVFVEDEIVTREGIRDNVDWEGNGFEFCGEATDGEMALQLLQTARPDLVITDIKMPFMDGLQLSKIIKEHMPWVKIVILSGHDEFEYAQEAIKVGVTEYLLKPVTVQDLHNALQRIGAQLERDKIEQENLRKLRDQAEENQAVLKERFLLKLVVGAVNPIEAIEKGQSLGMDLIARHYLVVIFKTELSDLSEQFNYDDYQHALKIITDLVCNNPDIYFLRRDWEGLILLIKGNTPEYLLEEKDMLLQRIQQEVKKTRYQFSIGCGTPKNRIAYVYQSFVEALVSIQNAANEDKTGANITLEKAQLLKIDSSAVDDYLRTGVKDDFDNFFNSFIQPLGDNALRSSYIKNYIYVNVVLAVVKFMNELGGDIDQAVSAFNSIETTLKNIKTKEQLKEQVSRILEAALAFRDNQTSRQYSGIIRQAKEYIDQHFADPDLSLGDVASVVNLSPSHFSVVFSHETGQTFKDLLTETRIKKAKELLRMTTLKSAEISYQVGYNDPHYFSFVFRKNTGLSPTEFRSQTN